MQASSTFDKEPEFNINPSNNFNTLKQRSHHQTFPTIYNPLYFRNERRPLTIIISKKNFFLLHKIQISISEKLKSKIKCVQIENVHEKLPI